MEGESASQEKDERLAWLCARVVSSLRIKPEVFQRYIVSENRCVTSIYRVFWSRGQS